MLLNDSIGCQKKRPRLNEISHFKQKCRKIKVSTDFWYCNNCPENWLMKTTKRRLVFQVDFFFLFTSCVGVSFEISQSIRSMQQMHVIENEIKFDYWFDFKAPLYRRYVLRSRIYFNKIKVHNRYKIYHSRRCYCIFAAIANTTNIISYKT